ncbi:MAG: hypothetical protein ACFB2W_00510 [Leptolyngbyaceae cyanobacterium]
MPTIANILTDPDRGLIPYLDNSPEIVGTYQRLQVRPWSFDSTSPDQSTGFRLRDFRSDNSSNQPIMTRTVALGRVFQMTSNINATLEAGAYLEQLCRLLHRAAECVMYVQEIDQVSGSTFAKQNQSNKSWYMVIFVQFDVSYYYS